MSARALRVAFVHPYLTVGGAQRLVVDAALAARSAGHEVTIFTARHQRENAFPETLDGSLDVRLHRGPFPVPRRRRRGLPLTIGRTLWLAALAALERPAFDVVVCDGLPHAIPFLRLATRAKIVYYCHFPDRLLAVPGGPLFRLLRAAVDRHEAFAMARAHRVFANSAYTVEAIGRAFGPSTAAGVEVLYPPVRVDGLSGAGFADPSGPLTVLSLARFDPKKNASLAVEAFARLAERLPADILSRARLTLAGAYDPRSPSSRETVASLERLAERLGVRDRVDILLSVEEEERRRLLASCACFVHTAENEHFGIAPVEAMAAGRPVVSVDSGGPRETVEDGVVGYLCAATPDAVADALARVLSDPEAAARMGEAGRARAARFSFERFGERFRAELAALAHT